MADNENSIFEAMKKAGKPLRPGDVAKMTGMDSKEVSTIISDLKKKREGRFAKTMLLRAC